MKRTYGKHPARRFFLRFLARRWKIVRRKGTESYTNSPKNFAVRYGRYMLYGGDYCKGFLQ